MAPPATTKFRDGGDGNGPALPQSFHQELRREDAGEGGSQRVDKIEDADAAADVAAVRDQEGDQDRQCRAHEQRWQHHQRKGDDPGLRHAGRREAQAYPIEDLQRHETEQADREFYDAVDDEKPSRPAARRPAAGKGAQAQPQQEGRDHRSRRFGVGPVDGEERALPHHLVQQRRDTGDEEKRIKKGHERSDSVGFVAKARIASSSRFRFSLFFFSSRIQVRGTSFITDKYPVLGPLEEYPGVTRFYR